jgi:hypothetical protein
MSMAFEAFESFFALSSAWKERKTLSETSEGCPILRAHAPLTTHYSGHRLRIAGGFAPLPTRSNPKSWQSERKGFWIKWL